MTDTEPTPVETEIPDEPQSDAVEDPTTETEPDENADTFPRSYVERLRRESAGYRERANSAGALAQRLARRTRYGPRAR